jgi:hypothetical protein
VLHGADGVQKLETAGLEADWSLFSYQGRCSPGLYDRIRAAEVNIDNLRLVTSSSYQVSRRRIDGYPWAVMQSANLFCFCLVSSPYDYVP